MRPAGGCAKFVTRILAASIAGAAILQACAVQPRPTEQRAAVSDLALALSQREQSLDSVQSPAVMEYSGPRGHFKAREQMIVRRPASLRVEAMSPLGVALVVAADGGQIAVFDPSKDTLMRGPATAATLERFTQIPMAPQAAVRLLLALSPDGAMLTTPPSSHSDEADMKLLTYARAAGVVDELGFTGGLLTRVREKLAGGQVSYEVRYSDYKDIGAIKFPYLVEATFPPTGTTVKLRYERPIVDGEIADSTFVLAPGPSTRMIDPGMSAGGTASAPRG